MMKKVEINIKQKAKWPASPKGRSRSNSQEGPSDEYMPPPELSPYVKSVGGKLIINTYGPLAVLKKRAAVAQAISNSYKPIDLGPLSEPCDDWTVSSSKEEGPGTKSESEDSLFSDGVIRLKPPPREPEERK